MATRIKKTDLARDALYNKVNTMIDEVNTKIDNKDSLPSQTGNAGKFLTTDGTNASWGKVKQIEIKQNLTNPSADTVPSTKAVSDESSRIVSIMDNKVSKSGDTMTGNLSITGDGWNLYMQSNSISYNTAPSTWLNKTIVFVDKNGASFGCVEVAKDHENINNIYLNVFSPKDSWCPIPLGLRAASDGNFGSTAPQCNWDNSIVTTVSHGSNYVRFGNGLQICWGVGGAGNVTLPAPFANTNYQVTTSQVGGGHTYNCGTENYTTTSFNIASYQSHWVAIGYWY